MLLPVLAGVSSNWKPFDDNNSYSKPEIASNLHFLFALLEHWNVSMKRKLFTSRKSEIWIDFTGLVDKMARFRKFARANAK